MANITRRHFARQMALVGTLCATPLWAAGRSAELFRGAQENGLHLDPQAVRKLASQVSGQIISPDGADYNAARSIFNLVPFARSGQ